MSCWNCQYCDDCKCHSLENEASKLEKSLYLNCTNLEEACLQGKANLDGRIKKMEESIGCIFIPDPFDRFIIACKDEGACSFNELFYKDTEEEYIEAYRLLYDDNYKRV